MKSAFERAMEKAERLGQATEEEKMGWKWVPEGNRLAAEFLRDKADLAKELEGYGKEERGYVLKGVMETLASNVSLPKTTAAKENLDRAMEGLKQVEAGELAGRIEYVVTQYLQYGMEQQKQAYDQLKQQIEEALRQQGRIGQSADISVETIPEFQREWMRVLGQIEGPYQEHLEDYKKDILNIE